MQRTTESELTCTMMYAQTQSDQMTQVSGIASCPEDLKPDKARTLPSEAFYAVVKREYSIHRSGAHHTLLKFKTRTLAHM